MLTVRDFTTVYDTYVQSEIHLMELQLEQVRVVREVKCRTKTKMTKTNLKNLKNLKSMNLMKNLKQVVLQLPVLGMVQELLWVRVMEQAQALVLVLV